MSGYNNEHVSDIKEHLVTLEGRTIKEAIYGRTELGYDILVIRFTDGTSVRVREEGQVGEFSVELQGYAGGGK